MLVVGEAEGAGDRRVGVLDTGPAGGAGQDGD